MFSVHSFVSRSCPTEWTQTPRILVHFLDTVVAHTKDSCGKCREKRVISESFECAVQRHYPLMDQNPWCFSVHSFVSRSCPTEWTQTPCILVPFLDTVVAHTKDSCGKCRDKSDIRIHCVCCATTLPFDGPESVVFSVHSFVSRTCPTEWTQAPCILVPFLDTVVAHSKDSCGKCLEKRVISESAVPRHYPLMDQNPWCFLSTLS